MVLPHMDKYQTLLHPQTTAHGTHLVVVVPDDVERALCGMVDDTRKVDERAAMHEDLGPVDDGRAGHCG